MERVSHREMSQEAAVPPLPVGRTPGVSVAGSARQPPHRAARGSRQRPASLLPTAARAPQGSALELVDVNTGAPDTACRGTDGAAPARGLSCWASPFSTSRRVMMRPRHFQILPQLSCRSAFLLEPLPEPRRRAPPAPDWLGRSRVLSLGDSAGRRCGVSLRPAVPSPGRQRPSTTACFSMQQAAVSMATGFPNSPPVPSSPGHAALRRWDMGLPCSAPPGAAVGWGH